MTPQILKIEIKNPPRVFLESKSKNIVVRNRQLSMRRYFLQKKTTKNSHWEKSCGVWKKKDFIFPNMTTAGEPALRNRICRSRDPFLDHLFAHFLNLWKPPNWRWWRQIKIKIQFDDSLEPILSASTTNLFSVFHPFWPTNCASRSCRARCI